MSFKEKFIAFIMKKWTAPIVCGICIVLIFAMSANSFAKYYTRVQEARAAAVAVYVTGISNDEQLWTKGYSTSSNVSGFVPNDKVEKVASKNNTTVGCVRIFMGHNTTIAGYTGVDNSGSVLPYGNNEDYQFCVTNSANGKVCEVALSYTITIEFPDNMPSGVTWGLKRSDGTYISSGLTTTSQTFTDSSFTLPAGVATTNYHIIQFADSGVDFTAVDKYFEDLNITITTTQSN